MKANIKQGKAQVSSLHVGKGEIIVNLNKKWPNCVDFDKKANELVIQVDDDNEAVRIRFSHPIDIRKMEVCKEQIVAAYNLREIAMNPKI